MSQVQSSGEAPAASLVGSLGIFTLADVLTLLAETGQTGELQVVGAGVDGRVWLDGGELSNAHVGAATTIGQAVFDLACVTEGWFYFTAGLVSSSGQPTVPVDAVLEEVRPQVDEWREIRRVVPLDAVVALSPTPPGDDVQIRGDQWRVLTVIGTSGHTVREVLDAIGGDQVTGLRALRELRDAQLVILDGAPAADPLRAVPSGFAQGDAAIAPLPSVPAAEPSHHDDAAGEQAFGEDGTVLRGEPSGDAVGSLAEVAIMPPPISADPWAPAPEPAPAESDGVA